MAQIAGWFGVILILLAYYLISTKRLDSRGGVYQFLNFLGAMGAGAAALVKGVYPLLFLESVWALIAFLFFITAINERKKGL